jgi:hypothetical protein
MAGISAIGNLNTAGYAPQSMVTATQGMPNTATTGTSGGGLDSLLGSLLGTGASVYGSQNAAEAQNNGILAGIGTQNQTMGNINNLFSTQIGAGNNAFTQLQTLQGGGANGAPPDYSGFMNSPGYQFALSQGENAIRSQAAANGSAYTPNTLANIGQFVAGTASQNYNNYVQQLLSTAGLGAQGNNTLSGANLATGGNISQLQQNSGVVQGAGVNSAAGSIGGALSSLLGGTNGSGVVSGIGSLLGSAGRGLSSLFGNSTATNSGVGGFGNYAGYSSDPNAPNYIGNVGNVGGNSIVSQYGTPAAPDPNSLVTDPNSLTNPYGNLDFGNFDTSGVSGNP